MAVIGSVRPQARGDDLDLDLVVGMRRASPRRSRARASGPARHPRFPHGVHRGEVAHVGQVDRRRQDLRLVAAGFGEQAVDRREHLLRLRARCPPSGRRRPGPARYTSARRRGVRSPAPRGACRRGGVRWSWWYPAPARRRAREARIVRATRTRNDLNDRPGCPRSRRAVRVRGVALGAFGAHALKARLVARDARRCGRPRCSITRGTRWRCSPSALMHAAAGRSGRPRPRGWLFVAGIVLFSGSLYALALTGVRGSVRSRRSAARVPRRLARVRVERLARALTALATTSRGSPTGPRLTAVGLLHLRAGVLHHLLPTSPSRPAMCFAKSSGVIRPRRSRPARRASPSRRASRATSRLRR